MSAVVRRKQNDCTIGKESLLKICLFSSDIYYQTCDEEEEACDFFGITEEYCTVTRCKTDLCNGQGGVTYTLGFVLLAVFIWCF